ncbi:MAG: Rrf2 family transcriptional regulator [Myxococcota bacterium]|nr:Rrf2 family transcriptional regulator [Myxococcota bacterium]
MKFSTRCRYATLALFDLAFSNENAPAQVRQIAKRQNIPLRFLEQIFQDLKRADLVDGKRGRNGGYVLNRHPRDIHLKHIIDATEGRGEQRNSSKPHAIAPEYSTLDAQTVHDELWHEISERIYKIYAEYTLADLVQRAEDAGLSRGAPGYMYFI